DTSHSPQFDRIRRWVNRPVPPALDCLSYFSGKVAPDRQRGGTREIMAIPGEKAIQMVRSAHGQAAQLDIAVTAVVVDPSGRMIALGRMDKARPITVEMALNKAYTAASFQQPTRELAGVAGQSWFQSLVVSSNGRIMPGGGALPIVEGGAVVGAVAVAGGHDNVDMNQSPHPKNQRGELGKPLFNWYRNTVSQDPLTRVSAPNHFADRRHFLTNIINRSSDGKVNRKKMAVDDPAAMARHIKAVALY